MPIDRKRHGSSVCLISMKTIFVLVALAVALSACSATSPDALVAEADCGPQTGMTGVLSSDIVGAWRWSWTTSADAAPSKLLFEFRADGTATTIGWGHGPEQWSYRLVDSEVWMSGADPGDDLQSLRTTWVFDGGAWSIAPNEIPGESSLERCTST